MKKKLLAGVGVAAMALLCGSLAQAKDWKTVVIGMEGAYEPYNLTDPSGKIVGFEPDLVMDLCARMKVECKIIAQDWDGMIPGLQAGKFIGGVAKACGGGGGGRPNLAQAGGRDGAALDGALATAQSELKGSLSSAVVGS